jgi:prevent-host-death family protein
VTATFAKNEFGQLLDQVIRHGAVAITKHRAAKAVLVSMDEYQALTGSAEDDLDVLAAEFDELLERMQTPAARKAMAAAFAASPARLRQAAVKAARKRS